MTNRRRSAAVAASIFAASLVAGVANATTASAASNCSSHYCSNVYDAPLYECASTTNCKVVDHMRTTWSWFSCRVEFGQYVGGPHPYRWEYTVGDVTHRPGYLRDTDIFSETDPLPSC